MSDYPNDAEVEAFYSDDSDDQPATDAVPCPECSGPTIPPDDSRGEHGWYCERCGVPHDADGNRLL